MNIQSKTNRHVPIIYGVVFCGIGLYLIFGLGSWLWGVLGALLIGLGVINFKVGMFASDRALKELTNDIDKDLSGETKDEVVELLTGGLKTTECNKEVILLLDDDVYEEDVLKFNANKFRDAFDDNKKLVQFFSHHDAFDYLISNRVNLIVSSSVNARCNRPYNDGGDIFIKACKTLFPRIPFLVYSTSEKCHFFAKHGMPDAYITKGSELPLLFSTIKAQANMEISTEGAQRKISSGDSDALFNLGVAYFLIEDYEKSLEILEKVFNANPNMDSIHYYLGYNYYVLSYGSTDKEALRQALEHLKIAANKMPDFEEVHYRLGEVYLGLEMYNEALTSFKQAISLAPDYACFLGLGVSYDELGKKEDAIDAFSDASRMEPDKIASYLYRGSVYFDLCEYKKAISDFSKAIKFFDARNSREASDAYNSRGTCYSRLGDYSKAIVDYNRSIVLMPNFELPYYNRGIAYFELGDFDKAIDDYKKAIELSQAYKDAYNNLGLTYQTLGMYSETINTFKEMLVKFPNFEKARKNLEETYVLKKKKTKE